MVNPRIMKTRNLILTIMAGLMLITSPSCQKAELNPENTDENSSVQNPSTEGTIFRASLETPGSPDDANTAMTTSAADTKMTLTPVPGTENQMTPTWEEGDQIKIFYMDPTTSQMVSVTASANAAGTSTDFTTETTIPESVETFYAVHPASLEASVDADGNFSVPAGVKSDATFTNACISIAKCGTDKVLRFKNICSVLKFDVETPGGILQISSMDGTPIKGNVHASLNASGEVVYAAEPYTGTAYILELNKIASENQVCYVPVLVGAQAKGVAINYKATYASPAVFADFAIPFERSRIYNIGTLDSHLVTDYYITTTGNGTKDGQSWENAGDVNTFKNLVGMIEGDPSEDNAVKCARYMQIWRTKGVTFHFGAGTYVFGDATADRLTIDFYGANGSVYSEFTIQGGYPAQGGDTTSPTNVTAFSGNDQYGILNVFDRARVHINDVTFTKAYNSISTENDSNIHENNFGAALYMKQKGSGDKVAPRVWLTNCIFKENHTNHPASTHIYEGGSCINLVHGAVYADHCEFRNNLENKRNGCVKLSGGDNYSDQIAYAFFNACTFTENEVETDASGQGSAIMRNYRKGSLLGLYNCTFYNNQNSGADATNHIKRNIITLDRSAIIANCTIVDNFNTSTDSRPLRIRADYSSAGYNQMIFANNLIIDKSGDETNISINYIGTSRTELRVYMEGGNLFGSGGTSKFFTNGTNTIINTHNEYSGIKYADIDNPSFTDNVFIWDGTLNNGATNCNFMSKDVMVNNVLKSSHINRDGDTAFSITDNNGETKFAGFYSWLNSIGAIDKDATGATRPETGWTPGAYQVPAQAN